MSHGTRLKYLYTLDVLTDGSEGTGDGTIFLSVLKNDTGYTVGGGQLRSPETDIEDGASLLLAEAPVAARYAISGLGDATSRLAADQRFKLHPVRAVLDSRGGPLSAGISGSGGGTSALWGLPSLLLALRRAGAALLAVVSVHDRQVEETVQLLHPSSSHNPTVRICRVPWQDENDVDDDAISKEDSDLSPSTAAASWWAVYDDEFVRVHAHQLPGGVGYLLTLKLQYPKPESVLVLPPTVADPLTTETTALRLLRTVPEEVQNAPIACGILIGGRFPPLWPVRGSSGDGGDTRWHHTRPCGGRNLSAPESKYNSPGENRGGGWPLDPYLLVRAQRQSRAWHAHDIRHFPWPAGARASGEDDDVEDDAERRLRTGTSLILVEPMVVVDRTRAIRRSARASDDDPRPSWPSRYRFDLSVESAVVRPQPRDDNEIDLDGVDGTEDVEPTLSDTCAADCSGTFFGFSVDLLCLGTGCAAPSPYRGASGYAITLDESNAFAFEVGEGFVTQWNRYSGGQSLLAIRMIWISHAHWDHYGGLVPLLAEMHRLRLRGVIPAGPQAKRRRIVAVPTVLAPDRVLRYLSVSFGGTGDALYVGISLQRPVNLVPHLQSTFPGDGTSPTVVRLDTVRVDHCAHSFGFVMGLFHPFSSSTFLFCYSGDTRPCQELVRACRFHSRLHGKLSIDFLLHEATFHDDDRLMCLRKKHSTVREALAVAKDVRAKRTMLTHFSQRYDSPPANDKIVEGDSQMPSFDGLRVRLFSSRK